MFAYTPFAFLSNPTKKLLQTYLFWVDFVQGISSVEEFKAKLQTIKDTTVYKNDYGKFYLTLEEAGSNNEAVQEIQISEILSSTTLPLFLLSRLERITLYDKKDLKNIPKSSRLIWTTIKDIELHMVLDKKRIIYPKDYPKDNPFRFGYQVFRDSTGLLGVYDVEADSVVLDFEYRFIKCFGNIAVISKDTKEYFAYDLKTKTILQKVDKTSTLSYDLQRQIDLKKIELSSYLKLLPPLKSQSDLEKYGLWGAKVWVMEVPNGYETVLQDTNTGVIQWNHYCSADIFDMSIELPVNFQKKNGEYVSLGIKHEYLVVDDRSKLKIIKDVFQEKKQENTLKSFEDLLKRGNLPDGDSVVPNYLKIKNAQYDDVDWTKNNVDSVVKLSSDEFNELVSQTDNGLLFTWLSTLSDEELQRFYEYNDKTVKLENGAEASSKEQFQNAMASINTDEITDTQRARATLQMPLAIAYAKNLYDKTVAFRVFRTYDYFKEYKEEKDARFEATLSNIVWGEMKYIPEYFEQVLALYKDAYDQKSEYHQKIFAHMVKRFGYLIFALDKLMQLTQNKRDTSLHWFVIEASQKGLLSTKIEMSVDAICTLKSDKKLIDFLTLMFISICARDDDAYLESLINAANTLFEWYPVNSDACEYAMTEMMKSVALKKVSVENANAFIGFFEELPKFYDILSYEKIMELKESVKHILAQYKPQDNEIFDNKEVKNKLILLNYLIDMEDLYYESGKE